jgi:hypothetical protein
MRYQHVITVLGTRNSGAWSEVKPLLSNQKILGSSPTINNNLLSYFDCKYFNGLLSGVSILTQNLNDKPCQVNPFNRPKGVTRWRDYFFFKACYDRDHTSLM